MSPTDQQSKKKNIDSTFKEKKFSAASVSQIIRHIAYIGNYEDNLEKAVEIIKQTTFEEEVLEKILELK